jgi:hypothetical protein
MNFPNASSRPVVGIGDGLTLQSDRTVRTSAGARYARAEVGTVEREQYQFPQPTFTVGGKQLSAEQYRALLAHTLGRA